jgi:hypothetical protein
MKRLAIHLPFALMFSAALSLSPAQAGSAINKCVDGAGRVTLTDQPCDAHTVSSSVAVPGTPAEPRTSEVVYLGNAAANAPLRQARWVPAASTPAHAALAGDMATMKQARVQMLLQDAAPRARLALLDR